MNRFVRKNRIALAGLSAAAAAMAGASVGFAAETPAGALNAETLAVPTLADPTVTGTVATLMADSDVTLSEQPVETAAVENDAQAIDQAELDCMAKVVHYEAGGQSRDGQLAVAQLMLNRVKSGRFAQTLCAVANQPGQFFNTRSYNPRRDTARWRTALDVSREAIEGDAAHVVPGALFFHAAYAPANGFFRSRQRIATLGGNVFYR